MELSAPSSTAALTRNTSKVMEQFDIKIAELKKDLVLEFKGDLEEIKKIVKEQSDIINSINAKLIQSESTVSILQNNVLRLKQENENLKTKFDYDLDQMATYLRRQFLRINGVEVGNEPEDSEKIVKIVKNLMETAGLEEPDTVIDRAHRIGRTFEKDQKKYRAIIVKFNNFRTRTKLYQKRNKLDKEIRVKLDLTKRRYNILKETSNMIDRKNLDSTYIYADINCRLKIVDKKSSESAFVNSIEEAMLFLSQC